MPTGILKKYIADKGFGFIQPDDNSGDIFAHVKQKVGDPSEPCEAGRRVYFECTLDPSKGKPKATNWYFADGGVPQAQQQFGADGAAGAAAGQAGQNPGVAQLAAANGVDYQALMQAANAAMGGPGGQSALLTNLAGLQGNAAAGSAVAGAAGGATPTPPPATVAAPLYSTQEVQVPASLMAAVVGVGGASLEEIKKKAGGDVQIEFGGGVADATGGMRTLKVRGPPVSASLGACLLLQRVTEVM